MRVFGCLFWHVDPDGGSEKKEVCNNDYNKTPGLLSKYFRGILIPFKEILKIYIEGYRAFFLKDPCINCIVSVKCSEQCERKITLQNYLLPLTSLKEFKIWIICILIVLSYSIGVLCSGCCVLIKIIFF
jgi:hypothetical protein